MDTKLYEGALSVLRDESGGHSSSASNITKILAQIKLYQEKIRKHIEDNYVDFMPNHTSADLYLDEGDRLVREAEHLMQTQGGDTSAILLEAKSELAACMEELSEASLGLRLSYRILKVDDLFQCLEEASATKEYLIALDVLSKLNTLIYAGESGSIDSVVDRLFAKCDCYNTVKVKYHIQENMLKQNLQQRFEHLVQFTEKTYAQTKCVILNVSKDINQLQDTVMALFQARYNPIRICDFLLENCFIPVIQKPVSLEYVKDGADSIKLTLSYSLKDLGGKNLRPSYRQVFDHIKTLLHCLDVINVSVSPEQHVFSIIGEHIKHRLLTQLVDECLMYAIPETMDDLHDSTLIDDVLQFECALADIFLINAEHDRALTVFTEHFEQYFRNRFYPKLLDSAKEIMQKDLQDMTAIATENSSEDVANNPFLFPRCMLSKSVLELIKLLERMRRQASEGDTATDDNFLNVIASILQSYVSLVPQLHQKLLESIPQQSALFHNNCMYLAHWVAKNLDTASTTFGFPALVKLLQTTGSKYLQEQIAYQQKIIMGILHDFNLSADARSLGPTPLKLIRQCLRQMDLLRNVWQNVLPEQMYNQIFCELLNELASEVMRRIMAMEDISATVATELSELIDAILEKTPTLFKSKHEVVHIQSWQRLQHLKLLLNASMQEITDQWCMGAGILTVSFKSEEVKHIMRALFQNTDRRAKALTKII